MSLRHAVLGLLAERSASGYDLMKLFETSLADVWPATQSQVYGELGKLAAAGLLSVSAEGPRGRKEYAVTDAGRAELRHWLLEVEPDRVRRSGALLRVFFLGELNRSDAVAYLDREASRAAGELAELEQFGGSADGGEDRLSPYGRIVFEYGLRLAAMRQEWARWAAEQVRSRPKTAG